MAAYAAELHRTTEHATYPIGSVSTAASGMRRFRVYDLIVGASATPSDNAIVYRVQRHTAPPAGTTVTPAPLDPADAACGAVGADLCSGTPTGTGTLIEIALNSRATFRWVAAPGGELVVPATASNGVNILTPSYGSFTGAQIAQVHFLE